VNDRVDSPNSPLRTKQNSGLIDTAIILLISVGLTIFLFWLGTTFVGAETLSHLPDFIQNPFKAVWSSVATTSTGIGLAIVKALKNPHGPKPNYFMQVLLASGLMICVVLGIAFLARFTQGATISVPQNVTFIEPTSEMKKPEDFILGNPLGFGGPVTYSLKGTYELRDHVLSVHMSKGEITFQKDYHPTMPSRITHIAMALCYIERTGSGDQRNSYPYPSPLKNGADVSIALDSNPVQLPPLDFKVSSFPSSLPKKKTWLCAQIWNDMGGYFPAE
jgi:hypothetical protein